MKGKKFLAATLVAAMAMTSLAGCGSTATEDTAAADTTETEETTEASSDDTAAAADDTSAADGDVLTLEIYDAAANYQGVQTGWFGQVVKEKFNIELNIIAPQVAGDAIFQTRASTGNLGDIVILDKVDFADCVDAGLVRSIDISSYSNLAQYQEQIDVFNNGLDNSNGETYGIPTEMYSSSPMSHTQDVVYSSPLLRWDLYKEIGSPDIQDLDGLLDALEAMQTAHPTNDAGDPAYALSLWPDWDGGDGMLGIANVVQLTTWYGEKLKGSAILKSDNTFTPLTDKTASYYKMTKFLNDAYRRGLVDPDSGTQDWNSACAKMSAGQVYLMWYSWQTGFWNSSDRLADGTAFIFIPVADQTYYDDADSYYGSGRVFGVGSQVDDEKYERIMEFLDWYASPEGLQYEHDGIEGFNYEVNDDGTYTCINDNALMDNLAVPEEYGGGGYSDGNNAINQWIVSANSINPNTGETYNKDYWSSWKESTRTEMKEEWSEKFGADEPFEYMENNGVALVSPNVSVALPSDPTDISVIRESCNQAVCDYTWKMVFAADDAEFDALWDEMTEYLDGFGFQDLYNFDVEKFQVEVDAKIEASK